jgi:leucyl-tRNA synthetase
VEPERDPKGKIIGGIRRSDGAHVAYDGLGTMSKSKNNGVDPQQLIETYGADTARFFAIFASPPTNTLEWSDEGVEGSFRFLKRLWAYCVTFASGVQEGMSDSFKKATRLEIHSVLKQANYDLSKHQLNTVASAAMKILNALERVRGAKNEVTEEGLSILLRLLAPITPHICHQLWLDLEFDKKFDNAPVWMRLARVGRVRSGPRRDRIRGAGEWQEARDGARSQLAGLARNRIARPRERCRQALYWRT